MTWRVKLQAVWRVLRDKLVLISSRRFRIALLHHYYLGDRIETERR